ncbi:MAG: NADH-quinone oxidoreductase subunit F, partial [Gammaproteobacteria bacterium]|nr:NADH-quinone oxidoreductase subunit F [Gammaproteobacteria bacterium]
MARTSSLTSDLGTLLEQKNVSTEKDQLIEILHVINDTFGCLPKPYLRATSSLIGRNEADVYGVASFYHHFKIVDEIPNEKLITIRVCNGLSCCMSGAKELFESINRELETERSISVVNVPCVGRCEQAPIAVVQRNPIPNAQPEDVIQAVRSRRFEHPQANPDRTAFDPAGIVTADHGQIKVEEINNPDWVGLDLYASSGGYSVLGSIRDGSRSQASAIAELKGSNLRGLGGAGFAAGQKWEIVSSFDGPRYVVANLDEGEPGTFKDRNYLERDPHR